MEQYDKEFLEYMKTKYKLTLDEATKGTEPQIIKFAIAWDVWKQAKSAYSKREQDIYGFMSRDHSRLDYIFQEFRKSKKAAEAEQLFSEFRAGYSLSLALSAHCTNVNASIPFSNVIPSFIGSKVITMLLLGLRYFIALDKGRNSLPILF